MKHYKHKVTNEVYGYEDTDVIEDTNLVLMTPEEFEAFKNPPVPDDIQLQEAKDAKILAIDTQTSVDIELLVGDNNKQKAKIAEHAMLVRKEAKGTATLEEIARIDELEGLNIQIEQMKIDGNAREALVAAVTITTDLTTALAEVEAI